MMSNDENRVMDDLVPASNESSEERETEARDGVESLVQLFKLLADETRFRILLFLLRDTELNVRTLCEKLGQSQPAVSHHLALLRVAGLIECRREGKHNYYRIIHRTVESHVTELMQIVGGPGGTLELDHFDLRLLTKEQMRSS